MSLRLTTRETDDLVRAVAVLAAPFAGPSFTAWRAQCAAALGPLFRTDRTGAVAVAPDEPLTVFDNPAVGEMADAWANYYYRFDTSLLETGLALRLRVFHFLDLYDAATLRKSPLWTEWAIPYGAANGFAMAVPFATPLAPFSVHVYPDRNQTSPRRGRAILSLLYPVFRASAEAVRCRLEAHADIIASLEQEAAGVVIADLDGRRVHTSPNLDAHCGAAPAGPALTIAINQVLTSTIAVARKNPKSRAAHIAHVAAGLTRVAGAFVVQGLLLHHYSGSGDPLAVAVITREANPAPSREVVMERFGLTAREYDVAVAIAAGKSTQAIATDLAISVHTVRRHGERVFTKLGVTTRAAVGPRLHLRA
jgi:DNA-binding CsgD family transcriptional regulator